MPSDLPIEELGKTIRAKVQRADNMLISAGMDLIEARQRVASGEAGEVTWGNWLQRHNIGTEKAKVCLRIANDPDPEQALIVHREQRAAQKRKERAATETSGCDVASDQSAPVTTVERLAREGNPAPVQSLVMTPGWLSQMVALWRSGTSEDQAAFRAHIG